MMDIELERLRYLGKIYENKYGSYFKIINFINKNDITVKDINRGNIIENVKLSTLENKALKSPFDKSLNGVGYLGIIGYKPFENNKPTKAYSCWYSMINRCYYHKNYKDVSVCGEWHNFQNFAEWFYLNYYEIDGQRTELDKDILVKGNKRYIADNCIFVPQEINKLILHKKYKDNKLPIGVTYHSATKKYLSSCSTGIGSPQILGFFNTPEEAFYTYKKFKEEYIKIRADWYKNTYPQFPKRLYEALYNWTVDIDD